MKIYPLINHKAAVSNRFDDNMRIIKDSKLRKEQAGPKSNSSNANKKNGLFLLSEPMTLEELRVNKKLCFPFTVLRAEDGISSNLANQCSCVRASGVKGSEIRLVGLVNHSQLGPAMMSICSCRERIHCLWMLNGSKYILKN